MIRLFLTKDQAKTLLSGLESKRRDLRNNSHDPALTIKDFNELFESELFQIELLATFLEKATEE